MEGEFVQTNLRVGKEKTVYKQKLYKLLSSNINTMSEQDLTQYLFWDRHEQIANSKGRVVAVRDPERGVSDYLLLEGRLRARYVQGSIKDLDSGEISREPQQGEYLVTGSWFFGQFQQVSNSRINQIDNSFCFPKDSE